MSGASRLHTQLLHQSKQLATKEPRRPKQASLPRSISASYYALFHFLTFRAARQIVGASKQLEELRQVYRRVFEHGTVRKACESFQSGVGALPNVVEDALTPASVPSSLQTVAEHFVKLHQERQEADYDHLRTFYRHQALDAHERARSAIKVEWPNAKGKPATRFFLASLVKWKEIRRI